MYCGCRICVSSLPGLSEVCVGSWNAQPFQHSPHSEPKILHGLMLGAASHFSHLSFSVRFSSLSQRHSSSRPSAFPRCALFWSSSAALDPPAFSVCSPRLPVLPSGSHGACTPLLPNLVEFAVSDADKDHFCLIYFPANLDDYRSAWLRVDPQGCLLNR